MREYIPKNPSLKLVTKLKGEQKMQKNEELFKEKSKVYEQLAFIHEILTQRTQYFVSEFVICKDAITTLTSMTNTLKAEVDALAPAKKVDAELVEQDEAR